MEKYRVKMNIIDIIKFILVALSFLAIFVFFLKYLARRTEKKEIGMLEDLAQQTGFSYFSEDSMKIQQKINNLFDFGFCKIPIQKNVYGKFSGNNIFFFESTDEAISTAGRSALVPTWSVCLLEIPEDTINIELIYFHKNLRFGEMKKYKDLPPHWSEVTLKNKGLKKYQLMVNTHKQFNEKLCQEIIEDFSEFKNQFNKRIIPREISLQIQGRYIAVYADMWNFEKPEEYLLCLRFMKKLYNKIKRP